jgi:hypothetical protein
MSVETEIYSRITSQLSSTVAAVYDTKRPDGLALGALPIVVIQWLSAPPLTTLQGTIVWRDRLAQCSIFALDLDDARDVASALVTALHNYSGGLIKSIRYENQVVIFDPEDREYHIPVDFTITA